MKISTKSDRSIGRMKSKFGAFLVGALAALSATPGMAATDMSQSPLYVGSNVPGNLALVPSVEFPTLISVANLGEYHVSNIYVGYFNSDRCYSYVYDRDESKRHFHPEELAVGHQCSGKKRWSGNYLNWATTQTIDPFRSALTGGYRVRDTTTETWLEKGVADRNSTGNFPRRQISRNGGVEAGATPASWGTFRTRIDGLGNKMRFTDATNDAVLGADSPANLPDGTRQPVPYNPAIHDLNDDKIFGVDGWKVVYEVSVRVAVCVPGKLEENCNDTYSGAAKPEGLLQQYSDRLLYSIFGYLNNGTSDELDGGVMRARQKFIGPMTYFPAHEPEINDAREWDPSTGILRRNPDPGDSSSTGSGVADSGVINYLNKFGQMTGKPAKSYDNVSELFYTATRYFRKLGNVTGYSTLSGSQADRYRQADGFPVIDNWGNDDPVRYQCQANVILGIGDTNTWRDKNLPGSGMSMVDERSTDVRSDNAVDVVALMKNIWRMEGRSESEAASLATRSYFNNSAHSNSAYIAALAYDAHTRDIRADIDGKQTISTYWVDVVENGDYKNKNTNQYWLATKYGGFSVPEGFDAANRIEALPDSWWASGELVNNDANFKRPSNFYTAAAAGKMVESLKHAFENIVAEITGSGASFAANTTSLEAGAQSFQARFYSGSWRGELSAYSVDQNTGKLSEEPLWNAGDKFPADWSDRAKHVYVNSNSKYSKLTWSNLGATDKATLGSEDVVKYLLGDRSKEGLGGLRARKGILGDIVNSEPVYVGSPNPRLYQGATFNGASSYQAFVADKATRTPVVYVGANDGLLHGFNAGSGGDAGKETYAFMPNAAISEALRQYTQKEYGHRYTVDGEMTVADVYMDGGWKSVLVGTLGRGGRGIYALDVTNPNNVKFLWEKNGNDIPGLGNNLGKPLIAQVANGQWRVFVGNGPNSTGGKAQLVSINLSSGSSVSIDTGVGSDNALSAARLWDSDGDGFIDTAYAGDLKGNLWRFENLSGSANPSKLFTAVGPDSKAQPITAAPLVARNPATGKTWVYVGTGRYLSKNDLTNKDVQSWYGLIDSGSTISGRADLSRTDILAEVGSARAISKKSSAGASGWYMDLISPIRGASGERMVLPNRFQGKALVGTTRIPESTDPCQPSGTGYVMAIDPFTGGRLENSFFDIDGDGTVGDDDDTIVVDGVPVPSSGLLFGSGPNNPIFIGDVMQVTLDDGSSETIKTHSSGNNVKRVTWREIVGGGS